MIKATEKELAAYLDVSERYIREAYGDHKTGKTYNFIKVVKMHLHSVRGNVGTNVNLKTMAELLGITDKAAKELTEKNVLVKNDADKYDLYVNIKAYIKSEDEWNRKKKTEREILDVKKEIMMDKYHSAEDIELILSGVIMNFKGVLQATKRKIIVALEGAPKEDWMDHLDRLLAAAMNEMAKYEPPSNAEKIKKDL